MRHGGDFKLSSQEKLCKGLLALQRVTGDMEALLIFEADLSSAFAHSWGNRRCRFIVHIASLH